MFHLSLFPVTRAISHGKYFDYFNVTAALACKKICKIPFLRGIVLYCRLQDGRMLDG